MPSPQLIHRSIRYKAAYLLSCVHLFFYIAKPSPPHPEPPFLRNCINIFTEKCCSLHVKRPSQQIMGFLQTLTPPRQGYAQTNIVGCISSRRIIATPFFLTLIKTRSTDQSRVLSVDFKIFFQSNRQWK